MRRRSSGFGSVFQRKRANGSKKPGYYLAFSHRGRKVRLYGGSTRAVARARLSDVHAALERGYTLEAALSVAYGRQRGCPTFAQAADAYLAHVRASLKPSTSHDYEKRLALAKRDAPFANLPADEIDRPQLVAWLDGREASEELSGASYNRLSFLLSAVFDYCREVGHVKANPARGIRRRPETVRSTWPTLDQASAIIAAASRPGAKAPVPDEDFADFLSLSVYAGLRRGEVLGLQWRDADLKAGEVRLRPEAVKSRASARTVPLSAPALAALARRAKLRLSANPEEHVFVQRRGRNLGAPWSGTCVRKRWLATVEAAGDSVPEGLRLHDLRRCFGSLLLNAGADLSTVQELLGHSSYEVTKRVYAHLLPERKAAAVKALDAAFGTGG